MVPFSVPTCDYLTVTVPLELSDLVARQVRSVLSHLPGLLCSQERRWRVTGYSGSLFTLYRRGKVAIFTASGGALQALRDHDLFEDYLLALSSEVVHRVTRLDAALDFASEASRTVTSLYRKGLNDSQAFHLGQKAAPVRSVHHRSRLTGLETGTTYIGGDHAEVKARVYDKRELVVKDRDPDPGPLLRYELTVTDKIQPSLRDASDPTALFWHFMSPGILKKPRGVPGWEPGGEGFSVTASPGLDPLKALARRIEYSAEFSDICTAVRLLPHGVFTFCRELIKHGIVLVPSEDTCDDDGDVLIENGVNVQRLGVLPQMGVYRPPAKSESSEASS